MGLWYLDLTWIAGMCAEGMALLCAAVASRVDPRHRPIALLFAFAFASDVIAKAAQIAFLSGAPLPFTGAARAAYHVEVALSIAWPCVLALLAARTFQRLRPRATCIPVGAWLGVGVAHALLFPMSEEQTSRLFLGVEAAMLLLAASCVVAGWRSTWRSVHGVVLFLLGVELVVVVLGPFATNIFRDWAVARIIYTTAFTGLAFWYGARPVRPHLAS